MAREKRVLTFLAACLCGGLFLRCPESALAAKPALVSSSRSGVFIAYSQDRDLRNKMLRAAEGAFLEWEKIHSVAEDSSSPVILNDKTQAAMPRGGSAVVPLIFETETGMKVQVDLYDKAAISSGAFDRGLFTALALQAMHSGNPSLAGKELPLPPGWLVEALAEELRRSRDGAPEGLYSALIESGHPPELGGFFRQKPEILDVVSIVLYRAQAVALLQVLKKMDPSKKGFDALFADSAFSKGGVEPILSAFPGLESRTELSKLWTLNLARSTMPSKMASLTVEETDAELSDILKSLNGPLKLSETASGAGGAYLMRECAVRLFNLEFRAHPLQMPVLQEYRKIVALLARKPRSRVAAQIEELENIRRLLVQRSQEITDYLNWFEVTRLDALPVRVPEPLSSPGVMIRNDPYALCLDSLEARGW